LNPTFKTSRLILRPRNTSDLDQCILMDKDPQVTLYICGPWANKEEHRNFVIERMRTVYPSGLGYWSVLGKHDRNDVLLGWILLLPYNDNETEIGWRFTRSNWGFGYATEAASVILKHAFRTVHLSKVIADIIPSNSRSIRVAEKLGMQYFEDRFINGKIHHSYQIELADY